MERRNWSQHLPWLVVVALLLAMVWRDGRPRAPEPAPAAGPSGIIAFEGTDRSNRGVLYLVDTNRQAICAYQVVNNEFRLISSRSYAFDIQLEDSEQVKKRGGYPAGGTYRGVKDWVESARATPATRGGRRGAGGTVP